HASQAAEYIAGRLDALVPKYERGWRGRVAADGGLVFARTLRGLTERRVIDGPTLRSSEARRLHQISEGLQPIYEHKAIYRAKDNEHRITGPSSLAEAVFAIGRKGLTVSRYKGLGEMNPEQLNETTLEPAARALLQVKVAHVDEAAGIFSTLMGDSVEPRREFIQTHALSVTNLDI
ncbi:MAG: DNA gyrase subunit B, partial [Kiloniellaceae bacterium]